MITDPTTYNVEAAAQRAYGLILLDMGGKIPATVRTFADLHGHADANEYVGHVPWGTDLPDGTDPYALVNAVTDRVNELLANRSTVHASDRRGIAVCGDTTPGRDQRLTETYPERWVSVTCADCLRTRPV